MMNRVIGRYEITGQLRAVSALSVSEGKDGPGADITCQRDGLGRLIIPATALAGCLRRVIDDPGWGGKPDDKKDAAVSRITTRDAPFAGDVEQLEVRDGVAIDRVTGAAAEHMLYEREVVAPGAVFTFSLSLDVVASGAEHPQHDGLMLVAHLVNSLEAGIAVGGSTTRGLGQVCLDNPTVTWRSLSSRDSFLKQLRSGAEPVGLPSVKTPPRRTVTITTPWELRSPLLVSVPFVGSVAAVPRHTRLDVGVHLTLPGSSIKGVLRSHAERIIRTLTGADTPEAPLEQFRQDLPLVNELFGRAPDSGGEKGLRGAVSCADVLSQHPLTGWDSLLDDLKQRTPESSRINAATRVEQSPWLRVDDHVAISRWTGGSDDGKLFAWLAPWPGDVDVGSWEPMRLTVDMARLGTSTDAAVMLLAYVLRDLCDGWLAFGHGTTRGYGEVTADPATVTFTWQTSGEERTLRDLFEDEESPMVKAWQSSEAWHSSQGAQR